MKAIKRIFVILLATLLLASSLPLAVFTYAAGSTVKDEVLFSSSFEDDDKDIYVSKLDGDYASNVKRFTAGAVVSVSHLVDPKSIQGTVDYKESESKGMLFDSSPVTKFLTATKPSATKPVTVSFALTEEKVITTYSLTAANDESERDPKNWTLYGSADGVDYQQLDKQTGQSFSERGDVKTYTFSNTVAYRYYKLEITQNGNGAMTQLAELTLGTGKAENDAQVGDSPMASEISGGPGQSFTTSGAYDGKKALAVSGQQIDKKSPSYARNLLYSGLNIKVTDTTRLNYLHFASIEAAGYDYEYVSMHMVIDLKFTDGTYLSSLGAVDQNGSGMDPISKGTDETLYSSQWNYVDCALGEVAKGKTIDSVYVYFRKDTTVVAKRFMAYFDKLVIENRADPVYDHLSDYISTLRGTNNTTTFSRGLTSPHTTMPNGFNFFTPVTAGRAGQNTHYDYFKNEIIHFSVSHVPSTWTGDYGTWQFMANTSVNSANLSGLTASQFKTENLGATFSHENEEAKAHYYGVTFDEGSKASGVKVEITPTVHGVYVRFTFPKNAENVNIVFDAVRGGSVTFGKDGTFTGISLHTDRGSSRMQIYGEFDKTPTATKSNGAAGIATFPKGTTEVTMKFATSFISQNQAKHNLELEIPEGETFDSTLKKAQAAWDEICGMIEVEGASYTQLVTLYSNLYRMYAYPNLYSENKGTNEKPEWVYASPYKSGRTVEGKLYVNNGFWDTYRTAWAAYALLTPEKDGELLDGIVQHYIDNGWIPRWVAPGGTNSMLGTSSDIIFADAYAKGIKFNFEKAYESMLKNSATVSGDVTNGGRAENNTAIFTGFVSNSTQYGLSWTLEDYISDYCIGVMADLLGKTDEAEYYYNRARFYVNMYNSGFFVGKKPDGSWAGTTDGYGWWGDYSETNGWTMAFAPVYDGDGLAAMFGGQKQLLRKLNTYFEDSYSYAIKVGGGSIHEMVEAREVRMGLYSHSNQPAHAIPYLFCYAGAPERTQEIVREVLGKCYVGAEIGQGYIGDEDNGEMSAWYVLSALGLYPQNMGSGEYVIGSPLYKKATVHMDNGKTLTIVANNNSRENIYVQSLTVNGKAYDKPFIDHSIISEGATLVFEMGDKASKWGTGETPTSLTESGKADPAEDLVLSTFKQNGALTGTPAKNTVYSTGITDAANLFDNNSNTAATVKNGATVTVSPSKASRLLLYTVTSAARSKAPESLKLEASADGTSWVVLDEREELSYKWDKYTRAFAISDEAFANYQYYRLTIGGAASMQVAELEFLALASDGELGAASEKPVTSHITAKDEPILPDDPSGDPGDTPDDPSGDPGNDPEKGAPIGLIIGVSAGAVALIGGGTALLLILKKKRI